MNTIKICMNEIFKSKLNIFKKEKIDENKPGSFRERNLLGTLVDRLDNMLLVKLFACLLQARTLLNWFTCQKEISEFSCESLEYSMN